MAVIRIAARAPLRTSRRAPFESLDAPTRGSHGHRNVSAHAIALGPAVDRNLRARRGARAGGRRAGLSQRLARRAPLLDLWLPVTAGAARGLHHRQDHAPARSHRGPRAAAAPPT